MKTVLLMVGSTQDKHFQCLIEEYVSRVRHYIPFELSVIPQLRDSRNLSPQEQKEREGMLILKTLQPGDCLVLLDERGTERRSTEFARWLEKRTASSPRRLVFLIGGPYGFSPAVYERADEQISLSQMTLSHQMVRLFFVEQLYRAFTILHHEKYHNQ